VLAARSGRPKYVSGDVGAAPGESVAGLCSETGFFSMHEVPAMVGTKLMPEVEYNNHTFLFPLLDSGPDYTGEGC
jgi:hypothetical protein